MSTVRSRGEAVRQYVLRNVEKNSGNIAKLVSAHFGISRQAVNKHLKKMVDEKLLTQQGNTRSVSYSLVPLVEWKKSYPLSASLAEDVVWRNDIAPLLMPMPENVLEIWHYGFTEMFNNALDHSGGTTIDVRLKKTANNTEVAIVDNGVGIFKKIQSALDLLDERHAVLELAKGKLTTAPDQHTGEGIFFTSRMFDDFMILSGGTDFSHKYGEREDWILERDAVSGGTTVWMKLGNQASRSMKKVFDEYTTGEDYGFTKTVVPVKLAQYGEDKLVSRSQAKRLLARVDRFETVIFDFSEVTLIGQAFADEIFRVFQSSHPKMIIIEAETNTDVQQMIDRARN